MVDECIKRHKERGRHTSACFFAQKIAQRVPDCSSSEEVGYRHETTYMFYIYNVQCSCSV